MKITLYLNNGHSIDTEASQVNIAGIRRAVEEQATGCYSMPTLQPTAGTFYIPWRAITYLKVHDA